MRPMPRLFQKVGNKIMKMINKAAFVCGRQLVSSVVEQRYCNVFKGGACECPGQVWGQCSDTDMGMCLLITEFLESRFNFFLHYYGTKYDRSDFKQLWACLCVSVFRFLVWSCLFLQQDVIFLPSHNIWCTPYSASFCVYRLFSLYSLILQLYIPDAVPSPGISSLCFLAPLQVETCYVCNADKGYSLVRTADANL